MRGDWERLRAFLADELWREPEPGSAAGRALGVLQFGVMVAEGFVRDRLLLRASALSYFTVLSVIPMLAIASAIVGSIGARDDVVALVVDQLAAGSPDARARILELIDAASFGGLGTLGAVTLFVTTVLAISNIERALNGIWGVQQHRTWARRFADYLAVLVVAPLLLGTALSLTSALQSQALVQRLLELPLFAQAYRFGLSQAPTVVLSVAFAFLYWFLPNTRVRLLSALLGGAVAGVFVSTAQRLYLGLSVGVARYDALFGVFAALPLLFVWIYVFWALVLFGAEVAFAHQNLALYRREVRGRRPGAAEREGIGVRIALEVGRAFRDAEPAPTSDELADALRIPVRAVRDVLAHLQAAGIVAPRGVEREGGFQLARPAERIGLVDVLAALRGPREVVGGDRRVGEVVESLLAELDEGLAKGAAGRSLAELLEALPARAAHRDEGRVRRRELAAPDAGSPR